MFKGIGGVGREREGLPRQINRTVSIALRQGLARLTKQIGGAGVERRQDAPSTSCNASASVNTRNVLVRTFPWLLTARATRVMASSLGASAMTT